MDVKSLLMHNRLHVLPLQWENKLNYFEISHKVSVKKCQYDILYFVLYMCNLF